MSVEVAQFSHSNAQKKRWASAVCPATTNRHPLTEKCGDNSSNSGCSKLVERSQGWKKLQNAYEVLKLQTKTSVLVRKLDIFSVFICQQAVILFHVQMCLAPDSYGKVERLKGRAQNPAKKTMGKLPWEPFGKNGPEQVQLVASGDSVYVVGEFLGSWGCILYK